MTKQKTIIIQKVIIGQLIYLFSKFKAAKLIWILTNNKISSHNNIFEGKK